MKVKTGFWVLLLVFFLSSPGRAQQVIATAQRINSPQVAVAGTGDFVVVWSEANETFYSQGIFARLFDASGKAKGPAFAVQLDPDGELRLPRVAADERGNFVVVWQGGRSISGTHAWPGGDGDGLGVFAQRFDRTGKKLGSPFRLSRYPAGDQRTPNVAMASNGSFVAVWQDCTDAQRRCSKLHVSRFTASGERRGRELEIPVLTATAYVSGGPVPNPTPSVVIEPGGFAVGWTEQEACYKFEYEKFPVILHFNNSGQQIGERYRLDDGDCEDATGWTIAALTASGTGEAAAFFNGQRNSFQLFAQDGDPVGPRKVVSNQQRACESWFRGASCESIGDAAMKSSGDFAVVFTEYLTTGNPPTSRFAYQAQFFNALGAPLGGRVQVVSSPDELFKPVATFAKDGGLIVIWGDDYEGGSFGRLLMRRIPGG